MNPSRWLAAVRAPTLIVVASPVIMGIAMAYGDGLGHWPSAVAALLGALFIQAGTNLANDYYDLKNGVDTDAHAGPPSVLRTGLVSIPEARSWFIVCFVLAALCGAFLAMRAGWPIVVLAVVAILSGIFYSAGKKTSLAALGLGDIWVFVFFGPVAACGTYFVQTFDCNMAVALAGCGAGFWSAAIIDANNIRDTETDAVAGRKTLPVRFGKAFGKIEYLACLFGAAAIPVAVYLLTGQNKWTLAASLIPFLALPLAVDVCASNDGKNFNRVMGLTAMAAFIYGVIFSLGWVL
jgi:1,4-dihydroxy-2-naphthoate octaprenyltransferase